MADYPRIPSPDDPLQIPASGEKTFPDIRPLNFSISRPDAVTGKQSLGATLTAYNFDTKEFSWDRRHEANYGTPDILGECVRSATVKDAMAAAENALGLLYSERRFKDRLFQAVRQDPTSEAVDELLNKLNVIEALLQVDLTLKANILPQTPPPPMQATRK